MIATVEQDSAGKRYVAVHVPSGRTWFLSAIEARELAHSLSTAAAKCVAAERGPITAHANSKPWKLGA